MSARVQVIFFRMYGHVYKMAEAVVAGAREAGAEWNFAFDERPVDDDLGGDVRQQGLSPGLHLFTHGLEVPLHAVGADRNCVPQGKGLRVLR